MTVQRKCERVRHNCFIVIRSANTTFEANKTPYTLCHINISANVFLFVLISRQADYFYIPWNNPFAFDRIDKIEKTIFVKFNLQLKIGRIQLSSLWNSWEVLSMVPSGRLWHILATYTISTVHMLIEHTQHLHSSRLHNATLFFMINLDFYTFIPFTTEWECIVRTPVMWAREIGCVIVASAVNVIKIKHLHRN